MRRGLRVVLLTILLYVGVLGLFLAVVSAIVRAPESGGLAFGPRVAVVELEGIILEVDDILRDLKSHRDNPLVRAVVVRINSPGGVVAPTQELYRSLQRMREAGKPVVASLGAVAASGGYYVAVAADSIYANPGTLTGSIGVVMQMANVETLMKKVGVEYIVVKAGQFKAEDYGVYSFMKAGGCSLAPLGTFETKVPDAIKAKVTEKEKAIKDGSFTVEINDAEPKAG